MRREDVETPLPEIARGQSVGHPARDEGAHETVLIVPGRIARGLQEGVDDRRHPQAPAQHANGVLDEEIESLEARELAQRPQAALQQRGQEEEVDREQRRREHPLDHAGERLVVEDPHAAVAQPQIRAAPFREERTDDVGVHRPPVGAVVERDIGIELVDDHLDLTLIEIPGDRPGHEAAEQRAKGVDAPAAEMLAAIASQLQRVEGSVDAREGERADHAAEGEAIEGPRLRQSDGEGDPRPRARDEPAREIGLPLIGLLEAAEEGRGRVRALQDRASQREQRRAEKRAEDRRRRDDEPDQRLNGQEEPRRKQQAHEDEAVDEALLRAVLPVAEHDRRERRRADEKSRERLGDEIGLAPEARLRQARRRASRQCRKAAREDWAR